MISAVRVARGSFYLILQSIISTVISLVAFAIVARWISREEMGVWVALQLVAGILMVFSNLGLSRASTKFISESKGAKQDYSDIILSIATVTITVSIIVAALCYLASDALSTALLKEPEYGFLFKILAIVVFLGGLTLTLGGILLGLQRVRYIALLGVLSISIKQLATVALLLCGYGLLGLIIGWIIGDLLYCLLALPMVFKKLSLESPSTGDIWPTLKPLLIFAWPLFLSGIVGFAYEWFDRVFLLARVSLEELAVYHVAYTGFAVLNGIPSAISTALFPHYSEIHGRNSVKGIEIGVKMASRYICLAFTPLAFGLAATAHPTITLIIGTRYAEGAPILAMLSVSAGLVGVSAALGGLLLVLNMTLTSLILAVVVVGAGLASGYLLMPLYGALGVAITRIIALTLGFTLTYAVIARNINTNFDLEAIWKSISSAVVMAVAVLMIQRLIPNTFLLPLYVLIGAVIYLLLLRTLKGVKKEDIQLLREFLGGRLGFAVNLAEELLVRF